jgi:hypothetical protein
MLFVTLNKFIAASEDAPCPQRFATAMQAGQRASLQQSRQRKHFDESDARPAIHSLRDGGVTSRRQGCDDR